MICVTCPSCNTALKAPDEYAGESPKCPVCGSRVPAAPDLGFHDSLVEDLLAGAEPPLPASRPAPPPPKKPTPGKPRRVSAPVIVTGAGLLVVVAAVLVALNWAHSTMQHDQATLDLSKAGQTIDLVQAFYNKGQQLCRDKQYARAKKDYDDALKEAKALSEALAAWVRDYAHLPIHAEFVARQETLNDLITKIRNQLKTEEMQYAAKGEVHVGDRWVSPEELEKRKRQGLEQIMQNGKVRWVTKEEKLKHLGHKKVKGEWLSPKQYAAFMKKEAKRKEDEARRKAEEVRRRKEEAARRAERERKRKLKEKSGPKAKQWVIDDFTKKRLFWRVETWENANPVKLAIVTRGRRKLLHLALQGGPKDKAAVTRGWRVDLTSRDRIELDVLNETGIPLQLAVMLITTSDQFESRPVDIRKGLNRGVGFKLKTKDFKCKATGWRHETAIKGLESVRRITFLVYRDRKGSLYFDNVVAIKGD